MDKVFKLYPRGKNFSQRFRINFVRTQKFALENKNAVATVIDHNGINLFIVWPVSNIYLCFIQIGVEDEYFLDTTR